MAAGEYPGSTFDGAYSGNYYSYNRPVGYPIDKVIVHTVQGRWWNARDWFKNPSAGVSAHYTVRSFETGMTQSVREKDIAYHAGNLYYNRTSIGIEHEGYVSNPGYWYTDTLYNSSAKLCAYLCKKYRIPVDRAHIIGHSEVPNPNNPGSYGGISGNADPGSGWDWTNYMGLVRRYVGTAAYSQTVDNATAGRLAASSRWGTSSYSAQKYGSNYRFLKVPLSVTDNARYKISTPSAGTYAVYAWWPADASYNAATSYRVYTTSGWKIKVVDQRAGGGRWNLLGSYALAAGDSYRVEVSSRSGAKGYIIADAVRVVRR